MKSSVLLVGPIPTLKYKGSYEVKVLNNDNDSGHCIASHTMVLELSLGMISEYEGNDVWVSFSY